ncbi:hypothetical protein ACFX5Q_00980 [Mesorhizobium sp. IMUNJ 23033]
MIDVEMFKLDAGRAGELTLGELADTERMVRAAIDFMDRTRQLRQHTAR